MVKEMPSKVTMEKLVSLCKRRGIIFQSSEIYGGLSACWDYGPLGVELKNNIKAAWWKAVVQEREDVVGLDASILMHPQTWVSSGHAEGFLDVLVDCKNCQQRWRADNIDAKEWKCPACGGPLSNERTFNLMLETSVGAVKEEARQVYLRPETAQGIFVNFQNVLNTTRKKLPFGIAQIGKAFRNEITTGNFIFRSREFEMMELEYFVKPESAEEWFQYWTQQRLNWYIALGIKSENLRLHQHAKQELAHYAHDCYDIEYLFPMGWSELEGIANRSDFDLRRHSEFSGEDLSYFDEEAKEHIVPYVIEPSGGVDRAALAFLADAYDEDVVEGEVRVILRLHPALAPIKVAVLPLSRNERLVPLARQVYAELRKLWMTQYDDAQSIGRRYRRQDEIGTPFCITIDFQSLEDNQVTIRERDTMRQIRVPFEVLANTLDAKLRGEPLDVLPPGGSYWLGFEG
jgi:glycyl-tRNA synthetase